MSNICQSGQCLYGLCIPGLHSANKLPMMCENIYDCKALDYSEYGIQLYSNCTCGFGTSGNSYCFLFPGDEPYLKLIGTRIEWINTNISLSCNTARRWEKQCIMSHYTNSFATNFEYVTYNALNYPLLQDTQDCVLEVVYNSYYQDYLYMNSYANWVVIKVILFTSLII